MKFVNKLLIVLIFCYSNIFLQAKTHTTILKEIANLEDKIILNQSDINKSKVLVEKIVKDTEKIQKVEIVELKKNIGLNHNDINKSQLSNNKILKEIKSKIDIFEQYINPITIGIVLFFLSMLPVLYGIEIFKVNGLRKKKEGELNTIISNHSTMYEKNEGKYKEVLKEYKERTEALLSSYDLRLTAIETNATNKIAAITLEASNIIRMYQEDIDNITAPSTEADEDTGTESSSPNDPFTD